MKEKEEKLEVEGEVIEALRSRMFRVRLDNGHEALGYMGGRMKRYRIRVFPGDRVRIELSSYDLTAAVSFIGSADCPQRRNPLARIPRADP